MDQLSNDILVLVAKPIFSYGVFMHFQIRPTRENTTM